MLVACQTWNAPEQQEDMAREVFQSFWRQMDQRYACFNEHPVDWDSVYVTNIVRMDSVQTDDELAAILKSVVLEMKDVQLIINPPDRRASLMYRPPEHSASDYAYSFRFPRESDYATENDRIIEYTTNDDYCFRSVEIVHQSAERPYRFAYVYVRHFDVKRTDFYKTELDSLVQHHPDGFIVDLRNNERGDLEPMMAFVRQFFDGERTILRAYKRETKEDRSRMVFAKNITVTGEGTVPQDKKVVLIINRYTFGVSNICAHIMSRLPNVTVIGLYPTGGGGADASWVALPHDWQMQYAHGLKYFAEDRSCERPLQPEVLVSDSACVDEELIPGERSSVLYINAALNTAMNIIENNN